ncbi:MAG: TetR/AcrR family transcriptional regulator [Pseudomonadota bacterium]
MDQVIRCGEMMNKSARTRAAILEQALRVACAQGLQEITLGGIADRMGMSKSGVMTRFGSIDQLQLEVVKAYVHRFEREVFVPALAMPPGLPRLQAAFAYWCRHVAAAMGRDALYAYFARACGEPCSPACHALTHAVLAWRTELEHCVRQAVESGQLDAATDSGQLAYEIYGAILLLHHDMRFHGNERAEAQATRTFQSLITRQQGDSSWISTRVTQ